MAQPSEVDKCILLVDNPGKAELKHPQRYGTTLKVLQNLRGLDYIDQRVNTHLWAHATHIPAGRLYCTVGGNTLTTVMTIKTYLQRALLHHYSKKSSHIKSAESMHLILKSKFQVLSLINQFKNNCFIRNQFKNNCFI